MTRTAGIRQVAVLALGVAALALPAPVASARPAPEPTPTPINGSSARCNASVPNSCVVTT